MNLVKSDGSVTIDATSSDSHINGLKNTKFINFKGFDKNFVEFEMKAPVLTFSGTYKMKAKFFGMTINGEGGYINAYSKNN